MNLFKKLLLSFFPEDIANQSVNPATIFVSLISSRSFFSVVNRRIIENYKLNLFDIGLDPVDANIGFGEEPLNINNLEDYYSYGIVANFNGYRFFSISNIASGISFVASIYLYDTFKKYPYSYFVSFLVSVYLLSFMFFSRLKVFPYNTEKENYDWFISTFFEFFYVSMTQGGNKVDKKVFEDIKKDLLRNIQVFFMLYYVYKRLNNVFESGKLPQKEYYEWLFYDELKNGKYKAIVGDFMDHINEYIHNSKFSTTEKKVMNIVFPADILIRNIFDGDDIFLIIENIIEKLYDKEKLDEFMNSLLRSDERLEDFLFYITDYNLYKNSFFEGVKKLTVNKFRGEDEDIEEEIDELKSSIGGEAGSEDEMKIPDRLKKESALIERLVNFYLTFVGGFWTARGDNFYIRLFRKNLLNDILKPFNISNLREDGLYFYSGLLYNYSKNISYYKVAYENFKKGKKFKQVTGNFRNIYSNMYILKLFDENFITTALQDINSKDIKLYIQNKEILGMFKDKFGEEISKTVKLENRYLLQKVYGNLDGIMKDLNGLVDILDKNLYEKDISNIKESLYTFDFWIWWDFIKKIDEEDKINLNLSYSDLALLGITSIFRETLFGFLIYLKYLRDYQKDTGTDLQTEVIKEVYLIDIINLSHDYLNAFDNIIENVYKSYEDILEKWINIDDNKEYFLLGLDNWSNFITGKDSNQILNTITGEDLIWFRGFLKNITYYNKRYLIPKD